MTPAAWTLIGIGIGALLKYGLDLYLARDKQRRDIENELTKDAITHLRTTVDKLLAVKAELPTLHTFFEYPDPVEGNYHDGRLKEAIRWQEERIIVYRDSYLKCQKLLPSEVQERLDKAVNKLNLAAQETERCRARRAEDRASFTRAQDRYIAEGYAFATRYLSSMDDFISHANVTKYGPR